MEILEKTFRQMPHVFTSNQFNAKAIENGYPAHLLKRKGLSKFLHRHSFNGEQFSKTWTKFNKRNNYSNKKESTDLSETTISSKNLSEENAITLLKSLGYKIMKVKYQEV